MTHQEFQHLIAEKGQELFRPMPWRLAEPNGTFNAYKIVVSELMLQQTQVSRVMPKFEQFIGLFPDVGSLAAAPLAAVLMAWSGLGYNRRAKYLHEAAKQLAGRPEPWSLEVLLACKGVGPNTARAVVTYVYNQPEIFIETNIRTVFIYHFFSDDSKVNDAQIIALLTDAIDRKAPRQWYWALMDYGAYLKVSAGNAAAKSQSYKKQSKFAGSLRQIRGAVVLSLAKSPLKASAFAAFGTPETIQTVLDALCVEGLIHQSKGRYYLGAPTEVAV